MDLKDIENSYIDGLSGGQKQRAYMAMVGHKTLSMFCLTSL